MRLSVVLPTRNGGAMLEGCLRSVLDQRYEDMELVVSTTPAPTTRPTSCAATRVTSA